MSENHRIAQVFREIGFVVSVRSSRGVLRIEFWGLSSPRELTAQQDGEDWKAVAKDNPSVLVYAFPENAVRALARVADWAEWRRRPHRERSRRWLAPEAVARVQRPEGSLFRAVRQEA
jgi:hypothetical protein